jgi:hypothetical protein
MEEFSKVAVGEIQRQFLIELKDKIKHKFNQVRTENEKLSEVSELDHINVENDELMIAAFFMNFMILPFASY